MSGRIVITVDERGQAGMESTYDQANTLLILEKVKLSVVSPPPPAPGIVRGALVPRLEPGNGH